MLTNATTVPASGGVDGGGAPKIHSGFKNAYVSVNRTLSAVVASATEGKPEVREGRYYCVLLVSTAVEVSTTPEQQILIARYDTIDTLLL